MILRAPNWRLPGWLDKMLGGLLIVLASPVIAAVMLIFVPLWIKRKVIGPRTEWTRWFAWHPVSVRNDRGFRQTRWLEVVERKSGSILSDIHKRPVGGTWEPSTW